QFPDPLNKKPVVVHSPSAPVAKGTKFILQAIESLKAKYDFEFVLVENMAREKALETMRGCDIFVDQLIIGSHGYAAVEAMAFGKPVVCYINPVTGKNYLPELPIFNANPENITEKLEILLKDGALRNELGKKGRNYVEKYHDDKKLAENLAKTYREVIRLHRKKAESI
ncbi:MAG TPA: glycosyltransferase, partial [Pyrinomonadaceae bacterium]|nr:glycosyltransferase [Pyrinomonadaceae bacterium]